MTSASRDPPACMLMATCLSSLLSQNLPSQGGVDACRCCSRSLTGAAGHLAHVWRKNLYNIAL